MSTRSQILIGASAATAAFSLSLPVRATAQSLTKVVVAASPSVAAVPLWYGLHGGLFKSAGLDIDYQPAASGTVSTLGVVGGTFQIGFGNALSIAIAYSKSVPLTVIASGSLYSGTADFAAAITRADSTIKTAQDLNGRVIGATAAKDLNAISLLMWIDQHGGDSKTVKVIEIPYAETVAALEASRIDIASVNQPFLSQAVATGKVRIFANNYAAIAPHFVTSLWMANPTWVNANSDVVRRFVRVMREAAAYCNLHHAESATLIAQYTSVDARDVQRHWEPLATNLAASDLQPIINAMAKYGLCDKPFAAADMISTVVRGLAS